MSSNCVSESGSNSAMIGGIRPYSAWYGECPPTLSNKFFARQTSATIISSGTATPESLSCDSTRCNIWRKMSW
eukprot:16158431-Heterocapsa_arctica.AAC.1